LSKIIQKAAERGYIEQTRRHGPTHAERWRSISEREGKPFLKLERRGALSNILVDVSTADRSQRIPFEVESLLYRYASKWGLKWELASSHSDISGFQDGKATSIFATSQWAAIVNLPADYAQLAMEGIQAQLEELCLL
jgi:hypothetical protein